MRHTIEFDVKASIEQEIEIVDSNWNINDIIDGLSEGTIKVNLSHGDFDGFPPAIVTEEEEPRIIARVIQQRSFSPTIEAEQLRLIDTY